MRQIFALGLGGLYWLGSSAAAGGAEDARHMGSDRFLAGSEIRLDDATEGDVIAAGSKIEIAGPVAGDVVLVGAELDLHGPFASDLYVAGATVNVDGRVAGSLRGAGGVLRLGPGGEFRGGVSVAAARAELLGTFREYVQVAAGATHLDATIAGDVDVAGGSLEVGPATLIQGALTFRGSEPPVIAAEARILGPVRHIVPAPTPVWIAPALRAAGVLGLALAGALAFVLGPAFTRSVAGVARRRTLQSLLGGAVVLFVTPLAVLLMLASIIGVPLGLFTLYVYVLLPPLGYLSANLTICEWLLGKARQGAQPRTGIRILILVPVLLVVSGVAIMPVIGTPVALLLSAIGIGSVVLTLWERSSAGRSGLPEENTPEIAAHSATQALRV